MSQWNNSYPYNNPFQEPGSWNREGLNSQHVNHNPAYFPTRQQFEPGNQYVSFGQFLSQIQTNGASQPNSTNYNGTQYQNYSGNHYSNFSNTTPTSSTQSDHHLNSYNYASDSANIPNSSESYQASAQSQYETASVQEPSSFKHEMLSKSNLTPTATEFIPKSLTVEPSTSTNQAIVSESSTVNGSLSYKNSRNNSKGKNWRERPSSSHHKDNSKQSNGSLSKNHKSSGNLEAFPEVSDPSPRQQENQTYRIYDKNKAYESSVRKVEGKNRKYDLNHKESTGNERGNSRQHDSTTRDSSRNYEGSTSENYEGSGRNYESNAGDTSSKSMKEPTVRGKGYEGNNSRSYDSGTRDLARTYEGKSSGRSFDSGTRDSARNFESNGSDRSYESPSRNYNGSRNYDSTTRDSSRSYDGNSRSYTSRHESGNKNQLKLTSKTKNKENRDDAGRTFYNSSANSSSQDARNARGEGSGRQRNWAGSQRVRAEERNMVDDEQFASNYTQYRDDHFERMGRDTQYREDRSERMGKDTQYREDRSERMGKAAPCREDRSERMGKVQGGSSPMKSRNNKNFNVEPTINKEMTQRERLSEQLDKGALECLVCCERVKQTDPVWSCSNCYHVLHLRCIRKWAMSSMLDGKWRCPACQNTNKAIPTEYRCMCGLVRNPEWQRGGGGAHTCGKACKRARTCPHPCTLLCHPGPCPPCQATVMKQCGCGAETRSVLCSSKLAQVCGRVCKKKLGCGVHECGKDCHEGDCEECTESVEQVCYCPAGKSRSVACTVETSRDAHYACGAACARVLACGAHVCRAPCHPPPCERCHLEPDLTETCPCGKMQIAKGARKACTDPIPVCGSICAKPLPCGPCQDKHFCKLECHDGACPVCPDKTLVQCNCGHTTREVPCADLPQMINNVFCQKKCNKKLSCGRHRCREFCCAVESHRCQLVCGRSLSCQLHRCQDTCHTGHCAPCPTVSFEELTCECGAEVILPPVRCGTKPPLCHAACQRTRVCGHEPHHSCHSGDCPPCVVLTHKRCHGGHEERKTIPCSQEEFSCGLPCGKPLPCGKHSCIKICHKGPCDTAKCTQPCNEKRPSCGHECGAACHAGDASCTCPSPAPCRRVVRARCACARRHADKTCADNARDRARIVSTLAASKIQESGSVDLSDMNRPGANLITLECDDECRVEQRTRQMALALQIRNPDVSAKLAPRYSEHVRSWAARDAPFAGQVHDKLTELVQRAKKSKQKTRSHSFPSMNWQKRQFIHELCEHFGCESVAYDAEPNRNVVATADKDKSWLPAMSVLEVLAREAGKRRVPGPMNRPAGGATHPATLSSGTGAASSATSKPSTGGWATLTSSNAWAARQAKAGPAPAASAPAPTPAPAASAAPKIDYFDYPPE